MSGVHPDMTMFLQRYPLEPQVWLGPDAEATLGAELGGLLPAEARLAPVPVWAEQRRKEGLEGPAVLLLTARDLTLTEHREVLLAAAKSARPGRPVVRGEEENKDLILDAINIWRVYHFVPERAPLPALADAIQKAHDAMHVEYALDAALEEYRIQRRRLQFAIDQVAGPSEQSMQEGRLGTVWKVATVLLRAVEHNLQELEQFVGLLEQEKARLPVELARRGQLALAGLRGTRAILADLSQWDPMKTPARRLDKHALSPLVASVVDFYLVDPEIGQRTIQLKIHDEVTVAVDRDRLFRVLVELLRASLRAVDEGMQVEVHVAESEGQALIEIWDFAHGLDRQQASERFAPFFSKRGDLEVGLGLHPCKVTIESFGGRLDATGIPRTGTCLRVRLASVG